MDARTTEMRLNYALAQVSSLTGEVVELRDRIARRDETINDLIAENERLLRENAEADAAYDELNSEVIA